MKRILILVITLSSLLNCSCSKCDENSPGDCKTCYERLAGGWTLNYFATNGVDSISYFDSLFNSQCIFSFDLYSKKEHYAIGANFGISWGSISGLYFFSSSYFGPISKASQLSVLIDVNPNTNLPYNPFMNWRAFDWNILKLSDSDLWFQLSKNNNLYEMHLNK